MGYIVNTGSIKGNKEFTSEAKDKIISIIGTATWSLEHRISGEKSTNLILPEYGSSSALSRGLVIARHFDGITGKKNKGKGGSKLLCLFNIQNRNEGSRHRACKKLIYD